MSRGPHNETMTAKPSANVYTVLTGVALVALILAIAVLVLRAKSIFGGDGLF